MGGNHQIIRVYRPRCPPAAYRAYLPARIGIYVGLADTLADFAHRLNSASREVFRACRTRALNSIAAAMVQLGKFLFPTGGRLLFGSDGNSSWIRLIQRVGHKATLDQWFVHKDLDDDPIHVKCALTSDPKAYYTMFDTYPKQNPFSKGVVMLLPQLISWIPEPDETGPFVLAHIFDIWNFIVHRVGR